MKKIRIALQLYSVNENCARDLPGTLKAIAKIGYEGVEFAGYHGRSAEELKKMLDDVGLKVAGTHIGLNNLLGDELKKTVKFNKVLDNRFLILAGLPEERRKSKAALIESAHLINKIAEKVKPEEMRVGYHNHSEEFVPMEGEMPFDMLFGALNPGVVMQLDIGHLLRGGLSPDEVLDILKRYPGRATTVHIKEYSSSPVTKNKGYWAMIGDGDMNWKEFFSLCETIGGTEWYIVEEEMDPLGVAEYCFKAIRKIQGKTLQEHQQK